jgi:hypothetical protein
MFEVKLKEIKSTLTTMISEEAEISEVTEIVKQQVKDAKFPDIEVVRMLWDVLMEAVQWSGKNQQQNSNSALRQVRSLYWIFVLSCNYLTGRNISPIMTTYKENMCICVGSNVCKGKFEHLLHSWKRQLKRDASYLFCSLFCICR